MTTAELAAVGLSDAEHSARLRRAVVASTVGTVIEPYDFLLYGQVAGLVFAKLYFPGSDPLVGTLQAFAIYAVGFVARPVGAALFGHWGDRIGRKATSIATSLLTGLSTFAVGFVPGYAEIGIWGAVILTVLRLIQGIGVGGEWGGAVCCRWNGRGPPHTAASSPHGRNGGARPDCFWRTWQCSPSAEGSVRRRV